MIIRELNIRGFGKFHDRTIDLTDGATDYRITLDTNSLNWYLEFEGDHYE